MEYYWSSPRQDHSSLDSRDSMQMDRNWWIHVYFVRKVDRTWKCLEGGDEKDGSDKCDFQIFG